MKNTEKAEPKIEQATAELMKELSKGEQSAKESGWMNLSDVKSMLENRHSKK